jgi:hypothetical protein
MTIIQDYDATDVYLETIPREDGFMYGVDEYGIDQRLSVEKVYELHCYTLDVAGQKVNELLREAGVA